MGRLAGRLCSACGGELGMAHAVARPVGLTLSSQVNAEVEDMYKEFQREKEDLLESIRMLQVSLPGSVSWLADAGRSSVGRMLESMAWNDIRPGVQNSYVCPAHLINACRTRCSSRTWSLRPSSPQRRCKR